MIMIYTEDMNLNVNYAIKNGVVHGIIKKARN
jgi:hypothetical protein